MSTGLPHTEQQIARCRLVLSLAAFVALYVDPTEPLLSRWVPLTSGPFVMDPALLTIMGAHLAYSLTVYVVVARGWSSPARVALHTMWGDVLFGAAIATLTEGVTSPFYPFFAFAVVVVGLRAGLRPAMLVTGVSLGFYGLYLALIIASTGHGANVYIMRVVYLAITGYLVGSLGQQRLDLEEEIRLRDVTEQRQRIGRDLHDGFLQAFAGITLRIESCRRLLRTHAVAEALDDLTELQNSVDQEHDALRAYMRGLAGVAVTPVAASGTTNTQLRITADLSGSVDLVDHVLQIVREGIANIRRHAGAQAATIEVSAERSEVRIRIDDDGVGFQDAASPWSIASRVREAGGELQITRDRGPGAHLLIRLPEC